MATREIDGRTTHRHKAVGYCCVFLAAAYVTAVVLLVGYLIALTLW